MVLFLLNLVLFLPVVFGPSRSLLNLGSKS
eukprot:SAG11_NODE_31494_length_291_cov_1.052083_1_plen_29_part_01